MFSEPTSEFSGLNAQNLFKMYFRTHLLWGLYMFLKFKHNTNFSFLVKHRLIKAANVHGSKYFTVGVDWPTVLILVIIKGIKDNNKGTGDCTLGYVDS